MSVQTLRSPAARSQQGRARPGGAGTANRSGAPPAAWLIVGLLFLFMLINFADKAVVGIAAIPLMTELRLSPRQFGLLGSSFFLLFSLSAIITGFIVNRVQTRWALLTMGLVWALTQFPHRQEPTAGGAGHLGERIRGAVHQPHTDRLGDAVHPAEGAEDG